MTPPASPSNEHMPEAVWTNTSNAFAHQTMSVRVPGILQDTLARNADYPLRIQDGLTALRDDIVNNAPLRMFAPPAPDYELWADLFEEKKGQTWLNTEWLFAETLVYRLVVEITQYWTTLRDPFAPFKQEELESDTLWNALSTALTQTGTREERLTHCFTFSLWGNRMDLSLKQAAEKGTEAQDEHLLTNHIPSVVDHLIDRAPGTVHIIMDNAGTEQALDLVLVDQLLADQWATDVILHVKMQPVLVSDALVADVHTLLNEMDHRSHLTHLLANRIRAYIDSGQLTIVPDFFWNTPGRMWALPQRLHAGFKEARLVISKGDFNYRRTTNDAIWPLSATLKDALPHFPAPFLALRTLKSDTLVGITEKQLTYLEAQGETDWRTSGTYGIAQFVLPKDQ